MQQLQATNASPSYRKNLLKELDVVTDNNAVSKRQWAKDLHRHMESRLPRFDGRRNGTGMRAPKVPERRRNRDAPSAGMGSSKTSSSFYTRDKRPPRPKSKLLGPSTILGSTRTHPTSSRTASLGGQVPRLV